MTQEDFQNKLITNSDETNSSCDPLQDIIKFFDDNLTILTRIGTRMLHPRHDLVDEAIQETAVKILNKHTTFNKENGAQFSTWAIKIFMCVCIDLRKNQKNGKEVSNHEFFQQDFVDPDKSHKINDLLIRRALAQLPVISHVIIRLFYIDEMTDKEIASLLLMKPHQVRYRRNKAVLYLRWYLESHKVFED